jgi:hypothetical protein
LSTVRRIAREDAITSADPTTTRGRAPRGPPGGARGRARAREGTSHGGPGAPAG